MVRVLMVLNIDEASESAHRMRPRTAMERE